MTAELLVSLALLTMELLVQLLVSQVLLTVELVLLNVELLVSLALLTVELLLDRRIELWTYITLICCVITCASDVITLASWFVRAPNRLYT